MYVSGEQFKNICDFYFYYDDLYAKNDHIILVPVYAKVPVY